MVYACLLEFVNRWLLRFNVPLYQTFDKTNRGRHAFKAKLKDKMSALDDINSSGKKQSNLIRDKMSCIQIFVYSEAVRNLTV